MSDEGQAVNGLTATATEIKTHERLSFVVRRLSTADRAEYVKMISSLNPSDRRFRFFTAIKQLPDDLQVALTSVDPFSHAAFVAEKFQPGSDPELCGVVRLVKNGMPGESEFAIVVAPTYRNCGLGYSLMEFAIAYARYYGFIKIIGSVLTENQAMLKICRELGFQCELESGNPATTSVVLTL